MKVQRIGQSPGDDGIRETLLTMQKLIFASDKNRVIKDTARRIIAGLSPADELGQIAAVFAWVKKNMRYVRDYYNIEELTGPDQIVYNIRNGYETHSSDCDDFAMVEAALLRSIGFKTRLEAVAVRNPLNYNHARVSVYSQKLERWIPLEGTKPGSFVGYALPSERNILTLEV